MTFQYEREPAIRVDVLEVENDINPLDPTGPVMGPARSFLVQVLDTNYTQRSWRTDLVRYHTTPAEGLPKGTYQAIKKAVETGDTSGLAEILRQADALSWATLDTSEPGA